MMEVEDIIKELEQLSEEIENAKTEKAQAEGRLQSMIESLQQNYGISEKELDKEIERTEKRRSRVGGDLQGRYKRLREAYDW